METLKVRCPKCQKLYGVGASKIKTNKPQFSCLQCHVKFEFDFPPPDLSAEILGRSLEPVEAVESVESVEPSSPIFEREPLISTPSAQTEKTKAESSEEEKMEITQTDFREQKACPKCGGKNPIDFKACSSCGVVFAKIAEPKEVAAKIGVEGSSALKDLWNLIEQDYSNEDLHEKFVSLALKTNKLPFASQKYKNILNSTPNEGIALRMREKIIQVATLTYVPPQRGEYKKPKNRLPLMGIGLGLVLSVSGLLMPDMQGLAILGVIMVLAGAGFIMLRTP